MKAHKKQRNLFLGLCALAVLVALITGGAVWALEGNNQEGDARKSMASRVAEILGLDEEEVQEAFQQASREIQDEKFQDRMDRLVAKGKITENEAVDAVAWHQSRPENIGPGHRGSRLQGSGHHRPGASFGLRGMGGSGRFAPDGS